MADVKYWEDLVDAPVRRFGPLAFPTKLLHELLDLMGEKHPIHDDPAFAARAVHRHATAAMSAPFKREKISAVERG